jgi:hypothetical protein
MSGVMESLQLAQMLADLSSLKAAVSVSFSACLVARRRSAGAKC